MFCSDTGPKLSIHDRFFVMSLSKFIMFSKCCKFHKSCVNFFQLRFQYRLSLEIISMFVKLLNGQSNSISIFVHVLLRNEWCVCHKWYVEAWMIWLFFSISKVAIMLSYRLETTNDYFYQSWHLIIATCIFMP